MARRITPEMRIKELFAEASKEQAERLLAIAQTVVEIRFPSAKKPARKSPKPRVEPKSEGVTA